MSAMDLNVDPCQDFFQYACGSWIRKNPIPEGKSMWGTFDRLWQENQIAMKTVLGELRRVVGEMLVINWLIDVLKLEQSPDSLANEAEKKAQKYYQSCLDVNETMESLGGKPILDLLTEIGGWPAINDQFNVRHWNFQRTIQITHNQLNMGGFFSWVVAEDDKNSSRHVIQVSSLQLFIKVIARLQVHFISFIIYWLTEWLKICSIWRCWVSLTE